MEGVLTVAAQFDALGDDEMVEECLLTARRLADGRQDAAERARVAAFAALLRDRRVVSGSRPEPSASPDAADVEVERE